MIYKPGSKCSEAMHRRWSIPEYAAKQRAAIRAAVPMWSEKDEAYLRASWQHMRVALIAYTLGKTTNAVIGKAHRLGLPPIPKDEIYRRVQAGREEKRQS